MRIGVVSDTHIPLNAPDLPEAVYENLKNCDLILHAGDLVEMFVLEKLKSLAPVKAVHGNMDNKEIKQILPEKTVIDLDGKFKIGLIHGYGPPHQIKQAVLSEFKGVDAIVFGHSHTPTNEILDGTLLFNPGSPTDKVFAPYKSFGILETDETIKGSIIKLR